VKNRRVAAITGDGKFVLVEEPVPELKKGQVLVEVKASLISPGTELGNVPGMRKNPDLKAEPAKFGYGNAGIVVGQGPGCEDIPVGMKVACIGAGYALHSNLMIPIPEGMSFEEASFAHLGATAMHALRRGKLQMGENFLVVGLGIIGQIAVMLGTASGVHVMATDKLPMRLGLAKKGGAELVVNPDKEDPIAKAKEFTRGYGMDCALLALGGNVTPVFEQAVKTMKVSPDTHPMGRVVLVGLTNFQTRKWPVFVGNLEILPSSRPGPGYHDENYEHGRDYPPVFVEWTTKRNLEEVLRMAKSGKLNLKILITHRIPIDKFAEGAEKLISSPNEALGVILTY
jgi:threonine dehydrogenase-like Zn-dependent dehydrogenase